MLHILQPAAVILFSANAWSQATNNILTTPVAVNYAPVADPQQVILPSLQPHPILLTGYDANGDTLSFEILTSPSQGSLTQFDPSTGKVTYNPPTGFSGSDSFAFSVNDGLTVSEPAVVSVVFPATSTLSASALKFGNQGLGNTSGTKSITIRNSGGVPLRIDGLGLGGPNASDFAYTSGTLPITVAPKKSAITKVAVTPIEMGARSAALTVFSNAATNPQMVILSANGVQQVTQSASSLGFAKQAVGTTSLAKSVTLTNNNTTPITMGSINTSGDFSSTTTCGATFAGKSKCLVSITFTPTATGSRIGSVIVDDSASNSPQTIALKGTGK